MIHLVAALAIVQTSRHPSSTAMRWPQTKIAQARVNRVTAIRLGRIPVFGAPMERFYDLELSANGRAKLSGDPPRGPAGEYGSRISPTDFTRLASLVVSMFRTKPPIGFGSTQTDIGQTELVAVIGGKERTVFVSAGQPQPTAIVVRTISSIRDWVSGAKWERIRRWRGPIESPPPAHSPGRQA